MRTLLDYSELFVLGAIAGLTIFLGLPLAVVQSVSSKTKGFLNAVAIGILIFLTVDVFSHAWESVEETAIRAVAGGPSVWDALLAFLAMFGGMGIGLLGLTWYGSRYMKTSFLRPHTATSSSGDENASNGSVKQQLQLVQQADAYRLAMLIAISIGAHNFSEGLAIGQSYASGAVALAVMLILGFAAHNATEGFGIAGPLTGLSKRPSVRFLAILGLVGGGPTFLGTVLGSLWSSIFAYVLFLAIAGGALVYVIMLMYNSGRRQTTNTVLMVGFFVGLVAGFITDFIVTLGGA